MSSSLLPARDFCGLAFLLVEVPNAREPLAQRELRVLPFHVVKEIGAALGGLRCKTPLY
jgi:hypothetical protein